MLFIDNFSSSLMRAVKFNRFLSLIMALNLIINTKAMGWLCLVIYLIATEVLIKIAKNDTLISKKVCNLLFNLNIILTTAFLLSISFVSWNQDYIFLCMIPIFQAALYRKYFYITGIIAASSAYTFVITFSLVKLASFVTVIGILAFLGIILSKTLTRTNHKADYLHSIATTDGLTGLLNRREFDRRIAEEFSRAKRHKLPLSLALFDIDFFKKFNDTYGHATGDVILKELSGLILSKTRNFDIFARYGGEEFALILPQTAITEAYELMDRLRQTVEKQEFNKTKLPLKCTISIGVAQLDLTDATPVDLIEKTDKALYKAKENGRNKVEKAPFGFYFISSKRQVV